MDVSSRRLRDADEKAPVTAQSWSHNRGSFNNLDWKWRCRPPGKCLSCKYPNDRLLGPTDQPIRPDSLVPSGADTRTPASRTEQRETASTATSIPFWASAR